LVWVQKETGVPKAVILKYKYISILALLLLLTACGYKPSSHAIREMFDEKIYVEVSIDAAEPENAPILKDELNRLVYTRFKGRIASRKATKSYIKVSYQGSTFTPLAYDNGYVTRYRTTVYVTFDMLTKKGHFVKRIVSVHESDIQASALQSSALRTQAIRKGLNKALDEFMAYVSAKSVSS
jgi:hypothetical protein